MKIVFVSHTAYPQAIGGRERHVHFLAKAFCEKRGVKVTVVTAGKGPRPVSKRIDGSYELIEVPSFSFKVCRNPLQVYHVVPSLKNVLTDLDPDLVHAFEYGSYTTTSAGLFAISRGLPFVLTVYGYQLRGLHRQVCKKFYDRSLGRFLLRKARAVICVSELQRQEMERIRGREGLSEVFVRPNSISLGDYKEMASRPVPSILTERFLSLGDGRVRVLSVARIVPRKGLDVLIRAVDVLVRELRVLDFRMILAGPDGGELPRLRGLVNRLGLKDYVDILAPLPYEEIGHLIRFCDVFASASLYEGVPLVFLEAMCFGKPVVGTSLPGNRVVVRNGETGFLVDPCDPRALAAALARLIADPQLRRQMGEAAIRRVLDFDVGHEADFLCKEIYRAPCVPGFSEEQRRGQELEAAFRPQHRA